MDTDPDPVNLSPDPQPWLLYFFFIKFQYLKSLTFECVLIGIHCYAGISLLCHISLNQDLLFETTKLDKTPSKGLFGIFD